jgi:hypothetical protein
VSRYIKEVHKCETPEILPSQNLGTVWECNCKLRWVIVLSHYNGDFGWSRLEKWKFNEAEDRLLTHEEILDYLRSHSDALPYRVIKPTLWERLTWRFRR